MSRPLPYYYVSQSSLVLLRLVFINCFQLILKISLLKRCERDIAKVHKLSNALACTGIQEVFYYAVPLYILNRIFMYERS